MRGEIVDDLHCSEGKRIDDIGRGRMELVKLADGGEEVAEALWVEFGGHEDDLVHELGEEGRGEGGLQARQ